MYVNDPIADMLTRIRNANMIYSESVDIPASKIKLAIARILKDEGYVKNFKVINDQTLPYGIIRIFLSYGPERERVIQGLRRISKPGRRIRRQGQASACYGRSWYGCNIHAAGA